MGPIFFACWVSTEYWTKERLLKAILMLSIVGNIFSRRYIGIFSDFFFPENRLRHFVQIVSNGDKLHEISNPVFGGKQQKYDLSSAAREY